MRKLGQALGYEAMSLYNHVANKDDLLDGMLDLVLAEMEAPDPTAVCPRSAPRRSRRTQRLSRHPWAAGLLMTPARVRPARLAFMDALLGALRDGRVLGRDDLPRLPRDRRAHHRLLALAVDARLLAAGGDRATTSARTLERMIPRETYPHLTSTGCSTSTPGPHQDVSAFEFALDLLLGGLERLEN